MELVQLISEHSNKHFLGNQSRHVHYTEIHNTYKFYSTFYIFIALDVN
jgi:hypothetical protein